MASKEESRIPLQDLQWDRLRSLLGEILKSNAFYQKKFQAAGTGRGTDSLDAFFSEVPLTTKVELASDREAYPPFGSNLTYPLEEYSRLHQTSGTHGLPMPWLDTQASWDWLLEAWVEVYLAAGVTSQDRVYFAFSFGPFLGFWTAFDAAENLGCLCLPGGGLSSAARLDMIHRYGATVLCCTPTYALRLAEVAEKEGISLKETTVRTIIVAGEPGGSIPATRSRISAAWNGARVFDHHGMTEVGPVTYECPDQPGLLSVIETHYLAEILDPETRKPVPLGSEGELVLTPLGRPGSPLIRYRTGDLVRGVLLPPDRSRLSINGQPCAQLALEGGILGRVDDMVVVRGVNIHPSAVEAVVRSVGGVAEYQVRIATRDSMSEILIEVEPEPGWADPEGLARQLGAAFQKRFALRVPVKPVPEGSLPRYEMKARRWKRDKP